MAQRNDERLLEIARERLAESEVEVLRNLIASRDDYERKCSELRANIAAAESEIDTLTDCVRELEALKLSDKELWEREAKVEAAERDLKFDLLRIKHAEEKVELVRGMFDTVFKNTIVRERVQRNFPMASPNGYIEDRLQSEDRETQKE